jgi:hypothetical protein
MMYLEDPVVWLSLTLGVIFMAGGGVLGRRVIRYSTEHKSDYGRVQTVKLVFACLAIGAAFLCIRGFQWRFGGGGQPYTEAFSFGLLMGLPLAWLFELRRNTKPDTRP